jgi:UPF0755 protein
VRRLFLLLLLLAVAALAGYYEIAYPLRDPLEPPNRLVIPQGATTDAIARELQANGLVTNRYLFRLAVLLRGGQGRLRAGEYLLDGPLSLAQIVDVFVRGEVVRREVTFPEGKTLEETAAIGASSGVPLLAFIEAARNPAAVRDLDPDATDLEGYLFPDTYELPRGENAAETLVLRMIQRFRTALGPDLARLGSSGLSLRELVTLASLVELETARPEERPRVAAVFRNRLKRGMPLQTDPTVVYALRKAGTYSGTIRKKDLDIDSPYNTYRHAGLPPGPIASPGRQSIEAVLDPAPVQDLYFVSRNDGTHQFSETLAEHERAVDRYQRSRPRGSSTKGR